MIAILISALFVLGCLIALIVSFVRDVRRDREQARREYMEELKHWDSDD